jgi:cytosine permease
LATQAPLVTIFEGILVGNVILGVFALLAGYIGAESGLSFYQLAEKSFGATSMRLVGFYVPIILIGWFGIESAILGGFLGKIFGLSPAAQRFCMFAAAIVMATSTYFGFRALKNLSILLIPIIFALGTFAILQSDLTDLAGRQQLVGTPQSLMYVAGVVVSTWIMGVMINLPDVTRFARTPLQGALIGFFGILIGNVFNLLIGAISAISTGQSDPANILIGLGFVPVAIVLAVANIWTTNDNNLYSATLSASRVLGISRHQATIVCATVGAVFAAFNPATIDVIFTVLIVMGSTAPALGGVVLGNYLFRKATGVEQAIPVASWLAWVAGVAVGLWLGSLYGIVAAFFVSLGIVGVRLWRVRPRGRRSAP